MNVFDFPDLSTLEVVYIPHWMGKVSLPINHREETEFKVVNGKYRLFMMAPSARGLPYGAYPRLLLTYLATMAKITKRREVRLGSSQAAFMKSIGCMSTGGDKGSLKALKAQSMRLFSTHMYYEELYGDRWRWENYPISDHGVLLWNPEADRNSWSAEVSLSEKFFEDAKTRAFPVYREVAFQLARKPTQFDIYCWLTSRANSMRQKTYISWCQLSQQFGNRIQKRYHFRYCFRRSFGAVVQLYPEVRFEFSESGLTLWPYPTHVPAYVLKCV